MAEIKKEVIENFQFEGEYTKEFLTEAVISMILSE